MTTTTPSTEARPLPLGIRRLPDAEHAACHACGAVCGPTAPRSTFHITGRADHLGVRGVAAEATFATCERCATLDSLAARTLDAHPVIRRAIGSPSIGRYRIVSAFQALSVLGLEPSDTYTHDALASLLDRLSAPGASASFSRLFSPTMLADTIPNSAATEPWLHVGTELRSAIRYEYGQHLADRMPPRPVACPTRGCAWCGIASVMAKRTAEPWTPVTVSGARGHLCPTCEHYRDYGGMPAAVFDYLDPDRAIRRRFPVRPELRDVRAWALSGEPPSAEPWAHVDIDGARDMLARGDW
jgi:hypothetical protein